MKCLICKKPLSSPESLALGIGPDCRAKYAAFVAACGSSVERIETLSSVRDAEVSRWLHFAKRAISAGRRADARNFLAAAERAAAASLPIPAPVEGVEYELLTGQPYRVVTVAGWAI